MNEVAVITANVNSFDTVTAPVEQSVPCDFYTYTEENLDFLPKRMSARLRSKYPKIQAHRLIPDYDVYIWIDARVKIVSPDFVSNFLKLLKGNHLVTTSHPDRKDIAAEFKFMFRELQRNNAYLKNRYVKDHLLDQWEFFTENNLPGSYPLFSAGICARWNLSRVNKAFDEWWSLVNQNGDYDQGYYSFCLWKHQLKFNTINFHNEYFKLGKHG